MRNLTAIPVLLCAAIAIGQPNTALAQDGVDVQEGEKKFASKEDKSGTNPINFQNEVRLYNEYQDLGNGATGNVTTFEYRTPFADGKWSYRIRVPYVSRDFSGAGIPTDESGLGDINMRVLTVPYLNGENGTAWAVGLEAWFPTASDDALGTDSVVLGPQVFFAKFLPFGIPGSAIFPGYQHAFSVGGNDDVNESRFDLFFLKQWKAQQMYLLLNPQYIIDWENDKKGGVFDAELGYVFKSGVSLYGRPGAGFGGDKPLDWNLEVGIKKVW
jgi:hypothetical protein